MPPQSNWLAKLNPLNLIKRSWTIPATWELTGNTTWESIAGPEATNRDTQVDRVSIWQIPAFRRGVDLISSTIARNPCHTYQRQDKGGRRRATEHPSYALIHRRFNSFTTKFVGLRQLINNALVCGNGYAYIVKNELAEPTDLYVIDPNRITPFIVYFDEPYRLPDIYYVLKQPSGSETILDSSQLIHIRGLGASDGVAGMPLYEYAQQSLGLAIATIRYGTVWFKSGGGVGQVVIELPTNFKDDQKRNEYRKQFEQIHKGTYGSTRPAILEGGAKLTRNSIDLEQSSFISAREASAVDVASLLNLPAHKLNVSVNSSYSSIEAENSALLSDCYDNWLTNCEAEFNAKLLTEQEQSDDSHYIEFNRDALLRGDSTSETTNLINQLNNGCISWQEYRAIKNLTTDKDEEQEWRIPTSVVIEGAEETEPEPTPPAETPEQEPEPTESQADDSEETETESVVARSKQLIKANFDRLKERLMKDKPATGKEFIARHKPTFDKAFPESEAIDDFIKRFAAELDSVLPEQATSVIERIDTRKETERVWNQDFAK